MITEKQYEEAVKINNESEKIINQYHKEKMQIINDRIKNGPPFTDDELRYSAFQLCPCGHGLAYPKGCAVNHYWECSAILKGIADEKATHTGQLHFAFYNVKGESDRNGTTRGVFNPKVD